MIPTFKTKEENFEYIRNNIKQIKALKKHTIKEADPIQFIEVVDDSQGDLVTKGYDIEKAEISLEDAKTIRVKAIINASNVIDSHMDCHIPKIWNKSISENKKGLMLLDHSMTIEKMISDDASYSIEKCKGGQLKKGFSDDVEVDLLVSTFEIDKDDNDLAFTKYKKGKIKQHSVGMRLMKYVVCFNSNVESDKEYKANWDKYYPMVLNKDVADKKGYFYAVTEAQVIECSAVVKGSNRFTPTESVEAVKNEDTSNESEPKAVEENTLVEKAEIDYSYLINNLKIN